MDHAIVTINQEQGIKGIYIKGHAAALQWLEQLPEQRRAWPTKQYPLCVFSDDAGMQHVPVVSESVSRADVDAYCRKYRAEATYRVNFLEQGNA